LVLLQRNARASDWVVAARPAQFAADPRGRLQWWFQQSKYEPSDSGRYPIVQIWDKN
jgi:hypothetical protein